MAPSSKNTPSQARPREKRSRSRAASPASASATATPAPTTTPYLHTSLLLLSPHLTIDALMDKHATNSTSPPSAASLHALHDSIHHTVLPNVRSRSDACDRSMRDLSRKRKFRADQELDRERREDDAAAQLKKSRIDKKSDPHRPPAVGARGLARQDGQPSPPPDTRGKLKTQSSPSAGDAERPPPPAPAGCWPPAGTGPASSTPCRP